MHDVKDFGHVTEDGCIVGGVLRRAALPAAPVSRLNTWCAVLQRVTPTVSPLVASFYAFYCLYCPCAPSEFVSTLLYEELCRRCFQKLLRIILTLLHLGRVSCHWEKSFLRVRALRIVDFYKNLWWLFQVDRDLVPLIHFFLDCSKRIQQAFDRFSGLREGGCRWLPGVVHCAFWAEDLSWVWVVLTLIPFFCSFENNRYFEYFTLSVYFKIAIFNSSHNFFNLEKHFRKLLPIVCNGCSLILCLNFIICI